MPLNIGYIENSYDDGDVVIRVYYDTTYTPVGDDQPLVNGPRGYCLDVWNLSGRSARLRFTGRNGGSRNVTIPQGNPVTSRCATAATLATVGVLTRGDVQDFQISALAAPA
jgi:hypothetical protein